MKVLDKLLNSIDLTEQEMIEYMQQIMDGKLSEAEIAAFLTALRMKGESVMEIVGGAKVLREKAEDILLDDLYTLDTCGTGGDKLGTYNISTAVAFVASAAGANVVKHGNRSVSSKCGSADVLEELGVKIDLMPDKVKECVQKAGIGFLFAQVFHKAMKNVGKVRKDLGIRTIFNILGPLANPAKADAQVLGVFDKKLVEPMANVLMNLGVDRAMVVHGEDGLDEISISGDTLVAELKDGEIKTYTINPKMFGMTVGSVKDIAGGDAKENAQTIINLLQGEMGTKRDILVLNAGAAIYTAGIADSLESGIKTAKEVIDSRAAYKKLNELAEISTALGKDI